MYFKVLFFCLILPISLLAQENKESLAFQLRHHLEIYSELNPDEKEYHLSDIDYTAERAKEEALYFEGEGEIDAFMVIWFYGQKIHKTMRSLIDQYSFEDVLHFNQNNIEMKWSADGRFFNYSINGKAGGTFQSRDSKSFYCSEDGVLYDVTGISSNGIAKIYTIESESQTKYLLLELTQSCTTCHIQKVNLVHFVNGKYISDFTYAMQNREGNLEIEYKEDTQRIKIHYTTDDMQSYCDCDQSSSWDNRTYVEKLEDETEHCFCEF